jgi:hypothetical protein
VTILVPLLIEKGLDNWPSVSLRLEPCRSYSSIGVVELCLSGLLTPSTTTTTSDPVKLCSLVLSLVTPTALRVLVSEVLFTADQPTPSVWS